MKSKFVVEVAITTIKPAVPFRKKDIRKMVEDRLMGEPRISKVTVRSVDKD